MRCIETVVLFPTKLWPFTSGWLLILYEVGDVQRPHWLYTCLSSQYAFSFLFSVALWLSYYCFERYFVITYTCCHVLKVTVNGHKRGFTHIFAYVTFIYTRHIWCDIFKLTFAKHSFSSDCWQNMQNLEISYCIIIKQIRWTTLFTTH